MGLSVVTALVVFVVLLVGGAGLDVCMSMVTAKVQETDKL